MKDIDNLVGLRQAGKPALAQLLNRLEKAWLENGDKHTLRLINQAYHAQKKGTVIGITGPPGAGKSTLIGRLIKHWRSKAYRVAVVAIDPSSRLSGGSLLGDRIRFHIDGQDDGLFVRSVAAGTSLGGVAESTYPMTLVLRALYDSVIIETVGVGQSEVDVRSYADSVVFCVQPGSGDSIQFIKAGISEIPDMVVVTKGDMPQAQATVLSLRSALALSTMQAELMVVTAQQDQDSQSALLADKLMTSAESRQQLPAQLATWMTGFLRHRYGLYGVGDTAIDELVRAQAPFQALADWLERKRR